MESHTFQFWKIFVNFCIDNSPWPLPFSIVPPSEHICCTSSLLPLPIILLLSFEFGSFYRGSLEVSISGRHKWAWGLVVSSVSRPSLISPLSERCFTQQFLVVLGLGQFWFSLFIGQIFSLTLGLWEGVRSMSVALIFSLPSLKGTSSWETWNVSQCCLSAFYLWKLWSLSLAVIACSSLWCCAFVYFFLSLWWGFRKKWRWTLVPSTMLQWKCFWHSDFYFCR